MMLRRAAEYSLLHELWGSINRRIRDALAIMSLFLVFATSLALFSGLSSFVGGALVAAATLIDIIRRSYDANTVMAKSFEWHRLYNNLVNDLTYNLMLESEYQQDDSVDRFATDFYNIKRSAPFVPPPPILGFFRETLFGETGDQQVFEVICHDDYQPKDIINYIPADYPNTRKIASLAIGVIAFISPWMFRSNKAIRELAKAEALVKKLEQEEVDARKLSEDIAKKDIQAAQKAAKDQKKKEMEAQGLTYSAVNKDAGGCKMDLQ